MYATTKEMKKTKRAGLGCIHAAGKIKMASRLAHRLKSLSPYVDEKVFRSLQKRLENIPLSERRSQKIQASKGRFFVICLLNSTADRGPVMLGVRDLACLQRTRPKDFTDQVVSELEFQSSRPGREFKSSVQPTG